MMLKASLLVLILAAVFLSSCTKTSTASLYTPASSDATATATLDELQQGRTLYVNNCGKCHNLYSPDDFSASQWKTIIPNMEPKTSISTLQASLVTKYVTRGQ
jgi:hypothetical protein